MFKSISSRVQKIQINSFAAGFCSMFILPIFFITVLSLLESKEYAIRQFMTLWQWMIPLMIGFGIQVGLYNYMRNFTLEKAKKQAALLVRNGSSSAGSMIICCLHHITEILPVIGISAVTVYLIRYQGVLMSISILFNILGIIKMLSHIEGNKLYNSASIFDKLSSINYRIVKWGVVSIFIPILLLQYII